jgi:hypothetical protein
MERAEYQVLRVKPENLESALNETSRQGWQLHSIHASRYTGRQMLAAQSLNVNEYHLVFHRAVKG